MGSSTLQCHPKQVPAGKVVVLIYESPQITSEPGRLIGDRGGYGTGSGVHYLQMPMDIRLAGQ